MLRFAALALVLVAVADVGAAQQSVIYLCARKGNVRQVMTPTCGAKEKLQTIALLAGNPPPQIVRMSRRHLLQPICENVNPALETPCSLQEVTSVVPLRFPLPPPLSVVPRP